MAPGGDEPDAPDWFEVPPGEERVSAEAASSSLAVGDQRIEEIGIVYDDDLSNEEGNRLGTATDTAAHVEDPAATDGEPEFTGEVPGFTDWREELRERLKRIRARREEERAAEGALQPEVAENEETAAEAEVELEPEAGEALEVEAAAEAEELEAEADEEELEVEAQAEAGEEELEVEARTAAQELEVEAEEGDVEAEIEAAAEEPQAATGSGVDETVEMESAETGGQLLDKLVGDRVPDPDATVEADIVAAAEEPATVEADIIPAADETVEMDIVSAADETVEMDIVPAADETVEMDIVSAADETAEVDIIPAADETVEMDIVSAADETVEMDIIPAAEETVTLDADETLEVDIIPAVEDAAAPDAGAITLDADTITLDADATLDAAAITLDADAITLDADGFDQLAEVVEFGEIRRDNAAADDAPEDTEGLDNVEIEARDNDADLDLDMVDEVAESILDELKLKDDEGAEAAAGPEADLVVPEPEATEPEAELAEPAPEAEADVDDLAAIFETDDATELQADTAEDVAEDIESDEAAPPADAAETFDFDEAAIDLPGTETDASADEEVDLPAAVMPDAPVAESPRAPELDFAPGTAAVVPPTPEIDVSELEAPANALAWDAEDAIGTALHQKTRSSAGPLGERAAAAVCDMMILLAIGGALVSSAASATGATINQILAGSALPLAGAWSIFAIVYSVFFVGSCGQTIGRMVMRLRVVHDEDFSVGFKVAAIRLAAWVVSAAPLGLGILPALKDRQNRTLHDRLSKTRVVKA